VRRVLKNALELAAPEGSDERVVLPAACLHDCVSPPKDSPLRARGSRLAADAAGGTLEGWVPVFAVTTDSRRVKSGDLFVALKGERFDGHDFAAAAVGRGAAALLVSRQLPLGVPQVVVADTLEALARGAQAWRQQFTLPLVGVGGSNGKTTTKELLTAMLRRRFRAACNPGNLNNLYGFPVALLGLPDDTEWMVAEMGMSTPGELARIAALGRPDVALFTNVRPVHLEFFGSLRKIAEAKAELLEALTPEALVVANADDPEVARFARRHPGPIAWYGIESRAAYRAENLRRLEG